MSHGSKIAKQAVQIKELELLVASLKDTMYDVQDQILDLQNSQPKKVNANNFPAAPDPKNTTPYKDVQFILDAVKMGILRSNTPSARIALFLSKWKTLRTCKY